MQSNDMLVGILNFLISRDCGCGFLRSFSLALIVIVGELGELGGDTDDERGCGLIERGGTGEKGDRGVSGTRPPASVN